MQKPLFKLLSATFTIGVFILSGCQSSSTDIFQFKSNANLNDNTTNQALATNEIYEDIIESKPNDLTFYEDAFIAAPPQRPIQKQVAGGIIPYNPNLASKTAAYFQRFSQIGSEVETVVIIARNYGTENRNSKLTTQLPYQTPYGLLEPDKELISQLTEKWLIFESNEIFKEEKTISFIAPFIKHSFPNAKVIPILLENTLPNDDAAILGESIAQYSSQKNTLVLAVSNFSNHEQYDLARFQTRYARSTIEAGDFAPLKDLNLDALNVLYALHSFLQHRGAHSTIFHDKGMADNRGYLMEYFISGSPRPTPEVTLIAVGDIMIDRYVRTLMERYGEDYPFLNISPQQLLKSAHLRLANLEGPVTDNRIRKGDVIFKFDQWMINILQRHGINLVTIANNHTLDQGEEGFENTKKYLDEAGLAWTGHPLNKTDSHTYTTEINGLKVGFIGLHDATIRLDKESAIRDIESMDPFVDFLIVTIHWGPEYVLKSVNRQQDLAHAFIDAGADTIIGHHPHVVQEIEWYNEKPIVYSLGNFIFDQYWSTNTQKGLSVGLIFSPEGIELYEFPIKLPSSQPELVLD